VGNQTPAELLAWVDALEAGGGRDACVLVGAPTSTGGQRAGALGLSTAYDLLGRRAAPTCLGGVAIAERHARKLDELQVIPATVRTWIQSGALRASRPGNGAEPGRTYRIRRTDLDAFVAASQSRPADNGA
jgi:excisionase family DNA binding protein